MPPTVWRLAQVRPSIPVQRPLARRRVILSRRVIAYYGLIRASGPLPPVFLFGIRLVFARWPWTRGSLIYSACPSVRAAFHASAGQARVDCSLSACVGLHLVCKRLGATASFHTVGSRVGVDFVAAKFALCYGPDSGSPFTDKGFYFRAFIP